MFRQTQHGNPGSLTGWKSHYIREVHVERDQATALTAYLVNGFIPGSAQILIQDGFNVMARFPQNMR